MENLHSHKLHIPLFSLLMFLLNFSSLHFLSLASEYERPDKYFINCGTDASANFSGREFTGDSNSGFVFSRDSETIEFVGANQPRDTLYQTARIFRQESYYKFDNVDNGTYFVRLHFLAFSSSSNDLSTAIFNVSTFSDVPVTGFALLNNFTAKSNTNSALIKEFFLVIGNGSLQIVFRPHGSSFAFVNAIEFFQAPADFVPENYTITRPLVLTYRVNVGGQNVTRDKDSLGRNWDSDGIYLTTPNLAQEIGPVATLHYGQGDSWDGFVWANDFVAPELVYKTAREMNSASNVTWSFKVSRNAMHLVRAHFYDINGSPGNIVFNLSSNGNFIKVVGPFIVNNPVYYDFVVNSTESELVTISIGSRSDSENQTAYLNGLEMLEIMEGSPLSNPPPSIPIMKESKKMNVTIVVGSVVGGLFLICILAVGILFGFKYRKEKQVETSEWSPMPGFGLGSTHSRFTEGTGTGSPMNYLNLGLKISFSELRHATHNFNTKLLIGEGGFGNVYRGTLLNGTTVAVKRAKRAGEGSGQGLPEFQTEIMVLSKIRHRHLVSLIGYCDERSEMILVYEFMEKGTLRDHLYNSNLPRLPWKQRLEICIGAARGLQYLHKGAAGGIIHRDVKSTNILLDENLVAKVADFGLSRSGPLDETHVSTNVKGTFGYLDPEYIMSQQLTEKSDVYSFGVVLLEVLCARPAIDTMLPRDQMNLAEWAMLSKKKGLLEQIVDPSLNGQIDPSSLRKFSETAEKCLQEDANDRPTMADVLWDLEYALQLQQTPKHREPHEDSTVNTSSAFVLPNIERFPSLSSTINRDDTVLSVDRDDTVLSVDRNDTVLSVDNESDTTGNEVFSQLKIGDAR